MVGSGLRVVASISGTRITLTIDIGFGDALELGAEVLVIPLCWVFRCPGSERMRARRSLPRSSRRWSCWGVQTAG